MHKKIIAFLMCTMTLQTNCSPKNNVAITMTSIGDRFGDWISNYLQAQWIAHVTGFSFLYKPFRYSDQLELHYHDTVLTEEISRSFKTHEKIKGYKRGQRGPYCVPSAQALNALTRKSHDKSVLYTLEFCWFGYDFDYRSDSSFISKMRQLIAPIESLPLVKPPENCISIALHLRTGIGYDDKALRWEIYRTRFPSYYFYAKAINDIMRLIPIRPLYTYIFTDHPSPKKPIREIQKLLISMQSSNAARDDVRNITWQWRTEDNRHDKNVLIDFFSLCNFDCLIRPWSGFSGCAEILGDHALIIDLFREDLNKPILYRIRPSTQSKRFEQLQINKHRAETSIFCTFSKRTKYNQRRQRQCC